MVDAKEIKVPDIQPADFIIEIFDAEQKPVVKGNEFNIAVDDKKAKQIEMKEDGILRIPKAKTNLFLQLVATAPHVNWQPPIRSDEMGTGMDSRTFECNTDYSIFVSSRALLNINNIHVFFSANPVTGTIGNDVLTHGLRAATEANGWILVGVPGKEPGFRTIGTAQIETCLRAVGRPVRIDKLRLSGHSRGYRGLRETIKQKLLDLSRVERVVVLDAFYESLKAVLETTKSAADPTKPAIDPLKVFGYDLVTRFQLRGAKYIQLSRDCVAAIGYIRLIQDSIATQPSIATAISANPAISNQLSSLSLPPRGLFVTGPTGNPGGSGTLGLGQKKLKDFCNDPANKIQIKNIISKENHSTDGLLTFINNHDLANFHGFKFDREISSHHFFVAEIAHELTE